MLYLNYLKKDIIKLVDRYLKEHEGTLTGGAFKLLKDEIQKEIKNYKSIVKHLEGHIESGDYDKLDVSQSKLLKKELNRLVKKGNNIFTLYQMFELLINHSVVELVLQTHLNS